MNSAVVNMNMFSSQFKQTPLDATHNQTLEGTTNIADGQEHLIGIKMMDLGAGNGKQYHLIVDGAVEVSGL